MKFGAVLPIWQLTVGEAESLALRAEEVGLDGVFVPDHILAKPATTQHYGAHWPDPFSLLSFLAGRTRRIQLGASVIVLPYRNALVAANHKVSDEWITDDELLAKLLELNLERSREEANGAIRRS